ncbi:unnamed protein product [Staurois parvus]|uniref:Uncharacterized protein n=1 Tax=Staurois parvus TaxID=386267 RepID=A0ABN9D0Z0_9NEOB|nr:unnamed protein product [Staurois parvus]
MSVGGIVPHHWCQWEEKCPLIGCQWEESCPIISVSGKNRAPSLVSVGGKVTPMRGHYSSHTDIIDGALLLPLAPMMGHDSSH